MSVISLFSTNYVKDQNDEDAVPIKLYQKYCHPKTRKLIQNSENATLCSLFQKPENCYKIQKPLRFFLEQIAEWANHKMIFDHPLMALLDNLDAWEN